VMAAAQGIEMTSVKGSPFPVERGT
jgi:hypothetical protein